MDNEEDRLLLIVLGTILGFTLLVSTARAKELPLAVQIVACESAGRPAVWGDDHKSFGIAQFQHVTFNEFARRAHGEGLDWRNPVDQLVLLDWALDHRLGHHWTCYRKIKAGTWRITPALERKMRGNRWITLMYGRL